MTKATKRTLGVICLLWLGTLLLLFANYKTKVYLEQLRSQVDGVTQQEQANATAVKRSDDVYLTVAVTLDEEHRSEQVDAIKRFLSDSVISDVTPKATLFDETVADDVSLEISDSYMQLQKGTDTVLVSAFQQSIDTSLLSKSLTLPNGLTLKYGDVKDSQTGYIPFIATVDEHKYKFLATSSDILLNMFEE